MRWPIVWIAAVVLGAAAPAAGSEGDDVPVDSLSSDAAPGPEAPGPEARATPRSALSPDALALDDGSDEAEAELSFSRSGAYVGLGATYAVQNFSIPGRQDDAASVMFRADYRGYAWLAVELLGEVLTTFDGRGSQDNDVKGYSVTVNARAIAPLGRVEPWAMVGIGFLDIDEDRRGARRDDFAFRSAVGVDLHLHPHWALYGEAAYMLPTGDVKRYDYATFGGGILYRF